MVIMLLGLALFDPPMQTAQVIERLAGSALALGSAAAYSLAKPKAPSMPSSGNTAPKSPKTAPKSPKTAPKSPKTLPKSLRTVPKSLRTVPKSPKTSPKSRAHCGRGPS